MLRTGNIKYYSEIKHIFEISHKIQEKDYGDYNIEKPHCALTSTLLNRAVT